MKKEEKIKDNLYDLYSVYSQYKLLYNFYQKFKNFKNIDEILERIKYLKVNPNLKQRTELETLIWILGENDEIDI